MNNDSIQRNDGRAPQIADPMAKLKREHSECIHFSLEIMRIAEQGSEEEVTQGLEEVARYNVEELEPHLQHEEQAILRDLIQQYPEHTQLCITIGKEHGYLRTLAEEMKPESAREDLAEFGRMLHTHTQMEDKALFPLVESLFTPEQMAAIEGFTALHRQTVIAGQGREGTKGSSVDKPEWLVMLGEHFDRAGHQGAAIVLFSRFSPEHVEQMATHLGLALFDFQKGVMADFGADAETLDLALLDSSLLARAQKGGIVAHNVEALLSVKSEQERRAWLRAFLDADWANPVVLPITLYQADVPEDHDRVCDLELHKLPRQSMRSIPGSADRIKYEMDER